LIVTFAMVFSFLFCTIIPYVPGYSSPKIDFPIEMSLRRLWQQQGKQHAARNTLAEIYGWFTEGFDTADLQEARVLLMELS
jgi:hypothetical protein